MKPPSSDETLIARLFDAGYQARPERVIPFTIDAWDVNCSQHITERYTQGEVAIATTGLRERLVELEAENARLRATQQAARVP